MRDFTKYDVWNRGVDFCVDVYKQTSLFPPEEKFGLTSQLRRAAVSIPSNFAEGCSRSSEKDFSRFVEISLGSAFELKTQMIIANRLDFLNNDQLDNSIEIVDTISRQFNALRNKLKNS